MYHCYFDRQVLCWAVWKERVWYKEKRNLLPKIGFISLIHSHSILSLASSRSSCFRSRFYSFCPSYNHLQPSKPSSNQIGNRFRIEIELNENEIMLFKSISLLSALAATVSAHGYVEKVTAGGIAYTGYLVRFLNSHLICKLYPNSSKSHIKTHTHPPSPTA